MQKGWEHHAVHAAVWQRHLRIWTREQAGTREGSVCERGIRIGECVWVWVCRCGCLLTCKLVLVFLLRAVIPEGTDKPSPLSWTPSDISPSSIGVALTPFFIMQNFSFTPETQRNKASGGLTGTGALKAPHLFYLNFYLLLLLKEELCWPAMAELKREIITPNPCSKITFPFFPVMAEIWICESDPASLCMWATPPWSSKTAHVPAIKIETSLPPSSGQEWERHFLCETTEELEIQAIPLYGGSNMLFSVRNWFQYRMMMSLISNYVFTKILQSLLVCLLFLVIHRCLTLCVCVCACVTERDVIHLTNVRLEWDDTHFHSRDSGRIIPGLPNYYSPCSRCLLTVVHFLAFPVVWS